MLTHHYNCGMSKTIKPVKAAWYHALKRMVLRTIQLTPRSKEFSLLQFLIHNGKEMR